MHDEAEIFRRLAPLLRVRPDIKDICTRLSIRTRAAGPAIVARARTVCGPPWGKMTASPALIAIPIWSAISSKQPAKVTIWNAAQPRDSASCLEAHWAPHASARRDSGEDQRLWRARRKNHLWPAASGIGLAIRRPPEEASLAGRLPQGRLSTIIVEQKLIGVRPQTNFIDFARPLVAKVGLH